MNFIFCGRLMEAVLEMTLPYYCTGQELPRTQVIYLDYPLGMSCFARGNGSQTSFRIELVTVVSELLDIE